MNTIPQHGNDISSTEYHKHECVHTQDRIQSATTAGHKRARLTAQLGHMLLAAPSDRIASLPPPVTR